MYLNISTILPLAAITGYIVLIVLIARQSTKRTVNRLFISYTSVLLLWALCSFMVHANLPIMSTLFWNKLMMVVLPFGSIILFQFAHAYIRKPVPGWSLILGYGLCSLLIIPTVMGYSIAYSYFSDGVLHYGYGIGMYVLGGIIAPFMLAVAYDLIKEFHRAKDPFVRNRVAYPLAGIIIMLLLSSTNFISNWGQYSIDQIANLINAVLISYAMLRYKLFDISLAFRRGFLYIIVTAAITAAYILLMILLQDALHLQTGYSVAVTAVITAIFVVLLYQPLLNITRRWIDRLFQREEYDFRQTLKTSSQVMTSMLNLDELGEWLLEKLTRTIGPEKAGLFLLDEQTHSYRPRMLRGYGPGVGEGWRADSPLIRCLEEMDHPLTREEMERLPLLRGLWKSEREELERLDVGVFVPLKTKGRLIGMLLFGKKRSEDIYTVEDLELLSTLANQASVAIENARLYEEAKHTAERLSVIGELTRIAGSSLNIREVYQSFASELKRLIDFDQLSINLIDEDEGALRVLAISQEEPHNMEAGDAIPLEGSGAQWVFLNRRPMIEGDLAKERRFPTDELLLNEGFRSVMRLPLMTMGKVFGTFNLRSKRPNAYSEDEMEMLEQVAGQLAVAIENTRLYEETKRACEELRTAQDFLIQSERLRALGEMAGGVAHDFNNILAAILGRAQLALEDTRDENVRKGLEIIERAALDGAEAVRRLQDFTRVRTDHSFELVDVNRVVEGAVEMVEHRRAERQETGGTPIAITVNLREAPPVEGNAGELREALVNVMLNAIDAMPDGGKLTVKTSKEDSWTVMTVSDTGVGMSAEMKARVFDPFFTTKGEVGVGLGLSVTYGIITRHGGRIDVESRPGKGSTFHIRLPKATSTNRKEPPTEPEYKTREATILVVDDDQQINDILKLMLTQLGHRVSLASSGEEALQKLKNGGFDLVITDLGMPGISGKEIAHEVKRGANTPVILITGWGVQIDEEEMRRIGADGLISKPFSKKDLAAQLSRLLGAGVKNP